MVALEPGAKAPAFSLKSTVGSTYKLPDGSLGLPIVLLAFFKVSCPVCQLAFPYLERLHRSYPGLAIWGISQDDADATNAFSRMYGVTFPMLLDEGLSSTVDYGLTNVPSVFLVDKEQRIVQTIVGFDKAGLEMLNQNVCNRLNQSLVPLFTAADEVPDLKPG